MDELGKAEMMEALRGQIATLNSVMLEFEQDPLSPLDLEGAVRSLERLHAMMALDGIAPDFYSMYGMAVHSTGHAVASIVQACSSFGRDEYDPEWLRSLISSGINSISESKKMVFHVLIEGGYAELLARTPH